MRSSSLMLVSVLVAGLAVPATARAARVDGQVPFEFTVGSTALPPGHYQIRFEKPERGIITVRNVDTGKVTLVEYLARIDSKEDGKSFFVFDEIEGQHVLRAIYVAGQQGYRLPAPGKQRMSRDAGSWSVPEGGDERSHEAKRVDAGFGDGGLPGFALLAGTSVGAEEPGAQMDIAKRVQRELAALPHYDVFDLLTYEVSETGVVTLGGYVLHTSLKADAETAVRKIAGVRDVVNRIEELLPLSNADER